MESTTNRTIVTRYETSCAKPINRGKKLCAKEFGVRAFNYSTLYYILEYLNARGTYTKKWS